jgi:hypothetical protein
VSAGIGSAGWKVTVVPSDDSVVVPVTVPPLCSTLSEYPAEMRDDSVADTSDVRRTSVAPPAGLVSSSVTTGASATNATSTK